jgi:hypothetical protein
MTTLLEVMNYTYHVSSSQRQSGTNTNFNINLAEIVNLQAKRGMFQIIFNSVQIPFTFYQLNSTNSLNILSVFIKNGNDASGYTTTITLTQGNYTPYTLITELQTRLYEKCSNAPFGNTSFFPKFTSSYSIANGYITFSVDGTSVPASSFFTLNFATNTNANTGGFFGISTITPTNVSFGASFTDTSTQPCVLNPINYLLVRSSLKQYRNREYITVADDVSDIVYKVPITTVQSSWINFYQTSEPLYIVDNAIQTINFYLTDNLTYNPINLQLIPWAFSFTLREVIRPDYEALNAQISGNIMRIPLNGVEEEKRILEEQMVKEKNRLELYKKKLERNKIGE